MSASGPRVCVRALAAFAAVFLAWAPQAAEAGFTRVKIIDSGGRKDLEDNTIYKVDPNEFTVNAGSGLSAYKVDANATQFLACRRAAR